MIPDINRLLDAKDAEIAALTAERDAAIAKGIEGAKAWIAERDALAARLAEAERLLRVARGEIAWSPAIEPFVRYISDFLSTAPQPSVCKHDWATDGIHETQCVKCGRVASDSADKVQK